MKRKIAALLVGDVVGYSSMMERAEERTVERLSACHALIARNVDLLEGRVFKTAGDAALAEFPSAVNSVRAAFEIRAALGGLSEAGSEPVRMRFGLHIADVVVQGDDLIGDGVNLATRIQSAAEPDEIYVSGALFDQIRRNSPYIFDDVGTRIFKNISEPVHLYRVRGEIGAHRLQSAPTDSNIVSARRPLSIAILPFRAVGEDDSHRYLAEGLTEELIVELGRFRRLTVSSRSASFALDAKADPVTVGAMLGVQYSLDGQVQQSGERIAITLTLSGTETGSLVWSDKIVSAKSELLDFVDGTSKKIAATVMGRIDEAGMVAARRKSPENLSAFDCVLRGLDHHRRGGVTDDNARQAVAWFTKAIEADPNYAVAYAWRFCSASWLPEFDLEEGVRDASRAIELDPNDAEANRIMAAADLWTGNYDEAGGHIRRAMELNPSDAYIKARCAAFFTVTGDADHALCLLDEAELLDPLLPVWCIEERGVALYSLGRYEEALGSLGGLTFQTTRSRLYRAACLMALGQHQQAEKIVREASSGNPRLTATAFTRSERYRDPDVSEQLVLLLQNAGLAK